MSEIKLGDKGRDKISGFEGIVTVISDWLNGCRRVTLTPQTLKDGKPIDSHTFDVQQVELIGSEVIPAGQTTKRPGGPSLPPQQDPDPR